LTEAVQLFATLLALSANAATIALVCAHVVAQRRPSTGAGRWAADALDQVASDAVVLAWLVAVTATLGSLYFSEVANFTPCTLCWYQRIAMYPLAVVLGVAALRHDASVRVYVWPLTAIGAFVAVYHYLLEWFPDLESGVCSASVPCDVVWFREFGFATLSYTALSGFLLIAVLLIPPIAKER